MTGRYKAYPEYKDSGLRWLPELPSNWKVERTKRMFALKRSLVGNQSSDYQLLSLTLKGVVPRDISSGEGKIPESFDTYQKVDENDLIFCLFDMDETPRTIGISPLNGMITGAYNVYGCLEGCCANYAYYYFLHIDSFKGLKPFYTGLRKVVRAETFGNIEMPCPSFEEQQKIANFLDHETAKIDTLITKQEKLIELLKEKRQAVISHAVTKGLNPDTPMKDSGVEWLGEVPEHWGVSNLSYYASLNTGATPDRSNTDYWDGDIPWIKTGEVRYDTIYNTEESISPLAIKDTAVKISPPGTLLMAMYGQGVTRGRVAILGVPATYNQACVAIEANSFMWNEYLKVFFIAAYHAIRDGGNETSQMNLNADIVSKFKITIPPITEQREIVNHLENVLPQFDALIEKSEKAIKLIQERKAALISATVTGKIDVRDWFGDC